MSRIKELKNKIDALYRAKNPERADWADWLYEHHIFVVADNAEKLSHRFGAREDLVIAAALLHDIADTIMARENPQHEEESASIAQRLLQESAFDEEEIKIIVDDALCFHGCHGNALPQTVEGKVMATADALAHLQTDFYDFVLQKLQKDESLGEIRAWALPKIERDFQKKIFFDEIRTEVFLDYERVKSFFT